MKRKIIPLIIFLFTISVVSAWDVTITATNQLEPIVFGVDTDATEGYDVNLDVYSSTPIQDKVIMSIDSIYTKSYVGENDGPNWDLAIGVPSGQATELKWELKEIPSDLDLFMLFNSERINMKEKSELQLDEGSHEILIEAESSSSTQSTSSGSNPGGGGGKTSTTSIQTPKPLDNVKTESKKTEKDLKLENIPTDANTVKEQKEIEQITTKEEPKNLNFIGILIIISIIVIGLLIYFITNKVTGGIKNE